MDESSKENAVLEQQQQQHHHQQQQCDSTRDFPVGRTVPFPYPNPYPQQTDFMDTLLRSLHQLSNSSGGNNNSNSRSTSCPVYMMESPTGTGKSLSLACAAMAWLRHVEQVDLLHPNVNASSESSSDARRSTLSHTTSSTRTSATADVPKVAVERKSTGIDWLDNWVSPEQKEADTRDEAMRQTATLARHELQCELQELHRSWQILDVPNVPNNDRSSSNSNIGTSDQKERQRARRENLTRAAVTRARQGHNNGRADKRTVITPTTNKAKPNDYHSDSDDDRPDSSRKSGYHVNPNRAQQLLNGAALDGSSSMASPNSDSTASTTDSTTAIGNVKAGSGVRKIIYAARTHSQLSQFIGELRRTAWGETVRVVHLGGRKALCGNQAVNTHLASEKTVTERCLDLQKGVATMTTPGPADPTMESGEDAAIVTTRKKRTSSSSTKVQCPLLQARDAAISTLALHLLAEPTDIEDAAGLGQSAHCCSYYASRAALAAAEVVVLPYSMLLSPQTRDSIGLSLQQSFVIVDEAHNLPEALRNLHSCRLTLPVILAAQHQLSLYTAKYGDRLAGRNLFYLGQIRRILSSFQKHLQAKPDKRVATGMMSATELLMARKLDNINLFEIIRYLDQSRLSQKLLGFMSNGANEENAPVAAEDQANRDELSKHVSHMSIVEAFLEKLSCSGSEGKVVTDWSPVMNEAAAVDDSRASRTIQHPALRYVLLQPATFFENVLQQASALALVGGTLRPFVHVAAELLGPNHGPILQLAADADRLTSTPASGISSSFVSPTFTAFTCDHVVPPSNVLLQCLARGPTGHALDLRYKERGKDVVCDELGRTLVQICQTVPCGVVIFLPSYSYEARIVQRWKTTGLWQELQNVKKIHREPKSSQHVESALQAYSRDAVRTGAVLLSIVGGKMSEGINFSDDMARCVVVIGLPYPDITDPELKEKMTVLDGSPNKTISGQDYYHNLCMRAVNQSVGRAIRHAKDYAALVLIDKRYTTDSRIWTGLSNWLKRGGDTSWRKDLLFNDRISEMKGFFATKTNYR